MHLKLDFLEWFVMLFGVLAFLIGCTSQVSDQAPSSLNPLKESDIALFVGQDLGSVGGLDQYDQGYVDYFGVPAGVTVYMGLETLEGLNSLVNYGAGDNHANLYLESMQFANTDIAIGLWLVGQLDAINDGELDENITKLSEWMKSTQRTVYLRIGYEFEGEWNGYDPVSYRKAFRRIVDGIRSQKVKNIEFVWQSSGYEEERVNLMSYYPGDDYVDWLAYSYFNHDPNDAGKEMLTLAREKQMPIMIAELTPRGYNLMLDDGKQVWDSWYKPFVDHVERNRDVIRIIAYINALWDVQPMWQGQGWGDTRLQANLYIANKWRRTVIRERWRVSSTVTEPPIFILPDDYEEQKAIRSENAENLRPTQNQWQAEDARPSGNVRVYTDGAAVGGKGMAYLYQDGDSLTFERVPQSNYIQIRYASEREGKIGLKVNGQRMYDVEFKATGAWVGNYFKSELRVNIPADSEVTFVWEQGDSAMNIDYVFFDKR